MIPTRPVLSKASRLPLISKHANKDYYKGNRVSALPGGPKTGAPGRHVIRGKAKYRLIDEKVRVFIAPPVSLLQSTPLKPYVSVQVKTTRRDKQELVGRFPKEGFTGQHYLDMYRSLNPTRQDRAQREEEDAMSKLSLYEDDEPAVPAGGEKRAN